MSEGWSMATSIPFKKPDRDIRPSPPEERALGYAQYCHTHISLCVVVFPFMLRLTAPPFMMIKNNL